MPYLGHQHQTLFKSLDFRHPLCQQNGYIYIRERTRLAARLGTEKVSQYHLIEHSGLFQTLKGRPQVFD